MPGGIAHALHRGLFSYMQLCFFCSRLNFLTENFTSERCFFLTPLVGYPVSFRRGSKFLDMFLNCCLQSRN